MEGTPFGRYTLLELIGRGGMGEVWRAHDPTVDRVVALKVLTPNVAGDEIYEERFRREAHAAAGLDEPHVVPIFDFGEVEGRLYVTMRLIQGHDLQTMLQAGPLVPARAVLIIEQIASALHAAHRIGLVHRDVKPSNIRVAENDFAYLIDFGIARAAGESGLTSAGAAIGTMAYMAPERFSTGAADPRADIYALTCVLYEALTGQQPYPGTSAEQQLAGHLSAPPPRPSLTQPGVPPAFDAVIATGMAKDPNQRYQTTLELAKAARTALTAPTIPIPQPTEPAPTAEAPASAVFGTQAPTAHAGVAPPAPVHGAPTHYTPPAPPPVFEPPAPRRRWSRRTAILAAAAAIAVVGAGIVAGITLSHRSSQTPTPSAGPPDTPKPKPPGPLDGTFTAQFGPKIAVGKPGTENLASEPYDGTWSIRSACPATGCVATATLTRPNSAPSALIFDDIDRRWIAIALRTGKCKDVDTEVWAVFTLQLQPDGTLSGEYIEATPNGCAAKQPLTFTRTGNVDPTVQVADPEAQPPRVLSPAQGLHGRYHLTMTERGQAYGADVTIRTDCLRTGDRCMSVLYNPNALRAMVFADGKWTNSGEGGGACDGGTMYSKDILEYPLPAAPQDPITVLTGHGRSEKTGGTACDGVVEFDEKLERIGD